MRISHPARALLAASVFLQGGVFLQGCGGTAFELPPVTDAEAVQAARNISSSPPPRYTRDNGFYRGAIRRIAAELERDVGPICTRAETSACEFHFHFVADDETNAYADEGGHIYLHRGILEYLETEAEIAAVMAHEMGHQIAGHYDESKASVLLGALLGGLIMGGAPAYGGTTQEQADAQANYGMELGARVGQVSYSKEQEREADLLAAYVLARAGYDPRAASGTFEVLTRLDEYATSSWRDTHPAGAERVVAWHKAVAEVEASPDKLPRLVAN
jgi:predicted Zn-dependent protease